MLRCTETCDEPNGGSESWNATLPVSNDSAVARLSALSRWLISRKDRTSLANDRAPPEAAESASLAEMAESPVSGRRALA